MKKSMPEKWKSFFFFSMNVEAKTVVYIGTTYAYIII